MWQTSADVTFVVCKARVSLMCMFNVTTTTCFLVLDRNSSTATPTETNSSRSAGGRRTNSMWCLNFVPLRSTDYNCLKCCRRPRLFVTSRSFIEESHTSLIPQDIQLMLNDASPGAVVLLILWAKISVSMLRYGLLVQEIPSCQGSMDNTAWKTVGKAFKQLVFTLNNDQIRH